MAGRKQRCRTPGQLNPLPSFLRASAQDAANMQMRAAGRTRWNDDDWNQSADRLDRLIRSYYGKVGENEPNACFIRFTIAEQWEKARLIGTESDWAEVWGAINDAMNTPVERAA